MNLQLDDKVSKCAMRRLQAPNVHSSVAFRRMLAIAYRTYMLVGDKSECLEGEYTFSVCFALIIPAAYGY